jgi:ubiquinone/menaquinone biosynthesis C-methylase UbiE
VAATTVDGYFEAIAPYWRDIYGISGVQAEIYRERHTAALDWVAGLAAPRGARALEIGCGAGFLAVAMARLGYRVEAIDSSQAMVELAQRTAATAQLTSQIRVDLGDAYALPFPGESFDLVVAIGLLPWLPRVEPAILEVARVLKPGGHAILHADNWARLNTFLDPKSNLILAPLKHRLKAVLVRFGLHHQAPYPNPTFHRRRFIDETLARVRLVKVRSRTIGFGPFSLFGRVVIPQPVGTTLHRRLQHLADEGVPLLRSTGGHYIVLAEKASTGPA